MAITRPDIYQHTNPNNAIVDSSFVRGGARAVADLTALYALSTKADQLLENVTKVWVASALANYTLIDDTNIGNSSGWQIDEASSTETYVHNQGSPSATWSITHGMGKKPSVVVIDSGGDICTGTIVYDTDNALTLTFSAGFSGTAYLN